MTNITDHMTFQINADNRPIQFVYEGNIDPQAPNAPQITIESDTYDVSNGFGEIIYRMRNNYDITISYDTDACSVTWRDSVCHIKQRGALLPDKEELTAFL